MTATFYFHVTDGDLRAEDAGDNVRIVVANFGWTILLEDRLDCARWMKALADADALFTRRKAADDDDHIRHAGEVIASLPLEVNEAGYPTGNFPDDDLEPLPPPPPLPQRKPAGPPARPWQAAMDAELSPEALAGSVPLATLAPETEDLPGPETGEWGAQSSVITSRAGEPLATLAPEQEDEAEA